MVDGGGGYPIFPNGWKGVPSCFLTGGYPIIPDGGTPIQSQWRVPHPGPMGVPHEGTPIITGSGTSPVGTGWGYHPPCLDWMGVPPLPVLDWMEVPHCWDWMWAIATRRRTFLFVIGTQVPLQYPSSFNTTKRDKAVIYQKITAFKPSIAQGRARRIKVLNYHGHGFVPCQYDILID